MQRLFETPAGVRLCALQTLPDGKARSFVLQTRAGRFHGLAVRRGEAVFGYADHCPHAGLPLAQQLDDYLTPDGSLLACSWHGALFVVEDGRCIGGPCSGQSLLPWPLTVTDGWIVTVGATL
ncbi:MAG TPA: Rieske (2Fe-2S) protein [Sphingobium sp.]